MTACEGAIHTMNRIFESNKTEAILIVEAENAFNLINWKALVHNIEYLCTIIVTFSYSYYALSAWFFIIGVKELTSCKETTQGNSTAMGAYSLDLG